MQTDPFMNGSLAPTALWKMSNPLGGNVVLEHVPNVGGRSLSAIVEAPFTLIYATKPNEQELVQTITT